jgi:hypothetical protein
VTQTQSFELEVPRLFKRVEKIVQTGAYSMGQRVKENQKIELFDVSKQSSNFNLLRRYPPITYHWTVPLILDHSYLVGISTSSKIADTKVSGF